jgi:long-chain acyl-CoA synthetase
MSVRVTRPAAELQSVPVTAGKDGETPVRRAVRAKDGLIPRWDENIHSLYHMFEASIKLNPDGRCMGTRSKLADGKPGDYVWQSYQQIGQRRLNFGAGLISLGLESGSPVGIYSINRPEWLITDLACHAYRYPSVSLYDTLGKAAVEFILNHAEIKLTVCAGKQLATFMQAASQCKALKTVVCMDEVSNEQRTEAESKGLRLLTMSQVEEMGAKQPQPPQPPTADDLYTIMYTSGTTGDPKGVLLTHGNLVAELTGVRHHMSEVTKMGFDQNDVHMSYLPLAHSFERAVCFTVLSFGAGIGFFRGLIPELFDDIGALAPTFLVGAPRVWSRLHSKFLQGLKAKGWLAQKMFETGFEWKKHYSALGESTPLIDSIVFGKAKARIGGRVKWILSGSAPLDPQLGEFLRIVFCCDVLEGYGLTENAAGALITEFNQKKLGHVGKPLVCTEVKLVDVPEMNYLSKNEPPTGEIMLRGYNVFKGYFHDEAKTKEALEPDGWFHTGDIGRFNPDGTLSIIDRKKNIFKLAQGEYVAVEYLEGVYIRSQYAAQVWVYGNSFQPSLVAVVVPDMDVLKPWADANGLSSADPVALCADPKVQELVLKDLTAEAKKGNLHGFEYVKGVLVTSEAFTAENDLMTPSFKLRRPQLLARYKEEIDAIYKKLADAEGAAK